MTAYEMRISDWSSDVCSSDLDDDQSVAAPPGVAERHDRSRDRTPGRPLDQKRVGLHSRWGAGLADRLPEPRRGLARTRRSDTTEEPSGGTGCVRTGRSRGSPET